MPTLYTNPAVIAQSTFASLDKPRAQIEELMEQAKEAKVKLESFMQMLSNNVENESGKAIVYKRVPNKSRQRICEKCGIKDWNDETKDIKADKTPILVKDIARASIVFSTVAQMMAFRDYIYNTPEYMALQDKQTPAVKDLWTKGADDIDSYKDVKFFLQVMIKFKGQMIPHIVELQLNAKQMDRGKRYGHAFYNISRLARVEGVQRFSPADPKCEIVIPSDIKGKVGNKLRTALTQCRSLSKGNEEIKWATDIMSKMLSTEFKMAQQMKKKPNAASASGGQADSAAPAAAAAAAVNPYDYVNDGKPLIIRGGPYSFDAKDKSDMTGGPARAWAIGRLSSLIWGHFTKCQAAPGVTGVAADFHAK